MTPDDTQGNLSVDDAAKAYLATMDDDEDSAQPNTPDDAKPDDDADLPFEEEESAEEDGNADDEDADEPEPEIEVSFVKDTAKIKLDDGTVVSVADLKRGNLFQADYTRKSQALAEDKKYVQSEAQRVLSLQQQLSQQRETIAAVAQAFMPAPPDIALMDTDMFGYLMQKEAYEKQAKQVNRLLSEHHETQQRQAHEQSTHSEEERASEAQRLLDRVPEFANTEKYNAFWRDALAAGADYGFTPEELSGVTDHRSYLVLRDAIAYRRLKAKNTDAKAKVSGKPPVMTGSNRRSPEAQRQQGRDEAMAKLNRTHSVKDGVAALLALEKG